MKISDAYTKAVSPVSRAQRRQGVDAASEVQGTGAVSDQVQLSGQGLEVQRARLLALQAPDIRESLVSEIVSQIRTGGYTITGAEVVPKLVREHVELYQ